MKDTANNIHGFKTMPSPRTLASELELQPSLAGWKFKPSYGYMVRCYPPVKLQGVHAPFFRIEVDGWRVSVDDCALLDVAGNDYRESVWGIYEQSAAIVHISAQRANALCKITSALLELSNAMVELRKLRDDRDDAEYMLFKRLKKAGIRHVSLPRRPKPKNKPADNANNE